jgi:hypothetical protein
VDQICRGEFSSVFVHLTSLGVRHFSRFSRGGPPNRWVPKVFPQGLRCRACMNLVTMGQMYSQSLNIGIRHDLRGPLLENREKRRTHSYQGCRRIILTAGDGAPTPPDPSNLASNRSGGTIQLRNRHLTILFVLCCLVIIARAQSPTQGKGSLVVAAADVVEGAAIPHAFVYIHGRGGKRDSILRLRPSGQSEISLTPGLYDLFVAADSFVPTCKVIEIVAGHTARFSAKLRADDEHLEESY